MKNLLLTLLFLQVLLCATGQVQTAPSYSNITRPGGGPILTGDVLEIRAVISVPNGTTISGLGYTDVVPANTTYNTGTLRAITNEAIVYGTVTTSNTGNFTDATGDDRAQRVGANIRFYVGTGATSAVGGSITGGTTQPRFYNVQTIITLAYRVTVTGTTGTIINLGGGTFSYTNSSGSPVTVVLTPNSINVQPNIVACTSVASANLITDAVNGSFGIGTVQNGGASPVVTGFTYKNIAAGAPQDGEYSIVKNTSPTQYTGAVPAGSDKVHTVFDIFGDHDGTNGTTTGNAPSASGAKAGYMLVVNASHAPSTVFTTATPTPVTPNTNYTLSFWLRNICPSCGADPAINGATSPASPGVKPNLAFGINGKDYYSTGEIAYTNAWVKRSFTFNSGVASSLTLSIRNNAPGGGGNDWVIDDINLNTCNTVVVLPVQLESFTAAVNKQLVDLDWVAHNELNVAAYLIERSYNGSEFKSIGQVKASGTNQGILKYNYKDDITAVPATTLYYRLKITDRDGTYKYSPVVLVKTQSAISNQIIINPNPVYQGNTNVRFHSSFNGLTQIHIIDVTGKILLQQSFNARTGNNSVAINNLSVLLKGTYIMQVINQYETMNAKFSVVGGR
jgi:Secretion system C-terminal sorting domain